MSKRIDYVEVRIVSELPSSTWYLVNETSTPRYVIDVKKKRQFVLAEPLTEAHIAMLNKEAYFADNSGGKVLLNKVTGTLYPETQVPAGLYQYQEGNYSPDALVPYSLSTNTDPINLNGPVKLAVLKDLEGWASSKEVYTSMGVKYKIGLLLYGSPGNGKSTLISQIMNDPKYSGYVKIVFPASLPASRFLKAIADIPKPKLFIFEELTSSLDSKENGDSTSQLLNFLDGADSVSNSITLATTNYPERLPGNIVDRPSRFDKIYEFKDPTTDEQKQLLFKYLGRIATDDEVKSVSDFSIAYIKEACLSHRIRGISLEQASKDLKERRVLVGKQFSKRTQMGF